MCLLMTLTFHSWSPIGANPTKPFMRYNLLGKAKKACGYLVVSMLLWTSGGHIPTVFAAANVFPTGPAKVKVGQTFNVVFSTSGAKDVDTIRLNGSFTSDILEYKASKPTGVFQNISPGTYIDQAKGIFSFGAFSLSSRANGNTSLAVLTFRAKTVGKGYVQLTTNSKMLSAGEEQIGSVGRLNIEVTEAEKPEPEQPRPLPETVPSGEVAIKLSSPSHPNPDAWYPSREITVAWEVKGKTVNKAYFGLDEVPEGASELAVISSTSTTLAVPDDGVYYAHLTIAFTDGTVKREHLRIQVDQTAPTAVAVSADQDQVPSQVPNVLRFGALDRTSGIAAYEVVLNGIMVTTTAVSALPISDLKPDTYQVVVNAIDRAGNRAPAQTQFEVVSTVPVPTSPASHKMDDGMLALLLILALLFILLLLRRHKRENISTAEAEVIHKRKKTKSVIKIR